MLAYIYWNVNPEIFPNSFIHIRWYGLFFVIAFYLGYFIMSKFFKKEGYSIELLDKLTIYMLVATIVGARLGHCFFYEPDYFLKHPLEILMVWKGGLASHGAAIAILLAIYLFVKKYPEFTFLQLIDRISITVALAGFWIRMGNLMNSEIYGVSTTLPWGFIFVRNLETEPKHPTQIYEALAYLLIFIFLISYYYKKQGKTTHGLIFSYFLIAVFTARFFIEIIKENQVPFEEHLPLNMGQILSIPFILAGIVLWLIVKKKKSMEIHSKQTTS